MIFEICKNAKMKFESWQKRIKVKTNWWVENFIPIENGQVYSNWEWLYIKNLLLLLLGSDGSDSLLLLGSDGILLLLERENDVVLLLERLSEIENEVVLLLERLSDGGWASLGETERQRPSPSWESFSASSAFLILSLAVFLIFSILISESISWHFRDDSLAIMEDATLYFNVREVSWERITDGQLEI